MEFKELVMKVDEKLVRKVSYRGGKRKIIRRTDKTGYRTDSAKGREVRMSAREKLARKKGAKRASKKRVAKKGIIARKRQITMRKRHD